MTDDPFDEAVLFALEERLVAGDRKVVDLGRFEGKLILYSDIMMEEREALPGSPWSTGQQPRRYFIVEYSQAGTPPIDGVTRFKATTLKVALRTFNEHMRDNAVKIALRALGVDP